MIFFKYVSMRAQYSSTAAPVQSAQDERLVGLFSDWIIAITNPANPSGRLTLEEFIRESLISSASKSFSGKTKALASDKKKIESQAGLLFQELKPLLPEFLKRYFNEAELMSPTPSLERALLIIEKSSIDLPIRDPQLQRRILAVGFQEEFMNASLEGAKGTKSTTSLPLLKRFLSKDVMPEEIKGIDFDLQIKHMFQVKFLHSLVRVTTPNIETFREGVVEAAGKLDPRFIHYLIENRADFEPQFESGSTVHDTRRQSMEDVRREKQLPRTSTLSVIAAIHTARHLEKTGGSFEGLPNQDYCKMCLWLFFHSGDAKSGKNFLELMQQKGELGVNYQKGLKALYDDICREGSTLLSSQTYEATGLINFDSVTNRLEALRIQSEIKGERATPLGRPISVIVDCATEAQLRAIVDDTQHLSPVQQELVVKDRVKAALPESSSDPQDTRVKSGDVLHLIDTYRSRQSKAPMADALAYLMREISKAKADNQTLQSHVNQLQGRLECVEKDVKVLEEEFKDSVQQLHSLKMGIGNLSVACHDTWQVLTDQLAFDLAATLSPTLKDKFTREESKAVSATQILGSLGDAFFGVGSVVATVVTIGIQKIEGYKRQGKEMRLDGLNLQVGVGLKGLSVKIVEAILKQIGTINDQELTKSQRESLVRTIAHEVKHNSSNFEFNPHTQEITIKEASLVQFKNAIFK